MASGIIEYLAEGAWTKRMHAGWAAQAGYRAARLAQAGFTGPRTVFEGEHGFFRAFANSDDCDFAAMLDGAGKRGFAADIAFKPYACGTMAHPYIDCARKLVSEGVRPEAVEAIECKTAAGIVHRLWEPLADKQHPANGYAAKFSIPYAIAVAMLRGDAGLVDYEDAVVRDPNVRALASKVRYVIDPANPYPRQFTGHVRVTLRNGDVREASQDHFRGGREAPLSVEALRTKFVANCRLWRLGPRIGPAGRWPLCARCIPRRASISTCCEAEWTLHRSKARSRSSPARGATSGAPSRWRSRMPAPRSPSTCARAATKVRRWQTRSPRAAAKRCWSSPTSRSARKSTR